MEPMNETEESASITETHRPRHLRTSGLAATGTLSWPRAGERGPPRLRHRSGERDRRWPRARLANWDLAFRRGTEGSLRGKPGAGGSIGRMAMVAGGFDRGRAGLARTADRHSRRCRLAVALGGSLSVLSEAEASRLGRSRPRTAPRAVTLPAKAAVGAVIAQVAFRFGWPHVSLVPSVLAAAAALLVFVPGVVGAPRQFRRWVVSACAAVLSWRSP